MHIDEIVIMSDRTDSRKEFEQFGDSEDIIPLNEEDECLVNILQNIKYK
jgi:hypothetical protein